MTTSRGQEVPTQDYAVVLYRPGPEWDHERPLGEQAGIGGHLAHLREFIASGIVLQAGPFHEETDLVDEALVGLVIFAASADAARELTSHDPVVQSGAMDFDVFPWHP